MLEVVDGEVEVVDDVDEVVVDVVVASDSVVEEANAVVVSGVLFSGDSEGNIPIEDNAIVVRAAAASIIISAIPRY